MRKSEMLSLEKGMQIQHKRNGQVLTVVAVQEDKIVCEERTISISNCTRWFDVVEIPEVVEPDNTILDDIEQADELTSEQDTTADTDTTATTATNIQVNELHEKQDTVVKKDIVEGNKADKITSEDIIYIIEHSNCDAVVKKQYIGAYKDDYKGTVCMVRTTKKGNAHIDIKQGIFDSLAESIRTKLQTKYAARVYDSTRGYIRLFEVDDLRVLQDLILAALKIA